MFGIGLVDIDPHIGIPIVENGQSHRQHVGAPHGRESNLQIPFVILDDVAHFLVQGPFGFQDLPGPLEVSLSGVGGLVPVS